MESGEELPVTDQLGVMVSEGRIALRAGRADEAIASLLAALDLADRTDQRELELELHDLLAVACKQAGRLAEALEHRERHFALHREIFTDAADLRMRTVQVAHDHENARHLGQITRLTTSGLVADYAAGHADIDAYHLEAYERLASLAEMRGGSTTRHTSGVGDLAAEIAHAIGQQPEWCERLRLAARLHDIGKVAINDRLLMKPGPLTVEEFDEIKQHTVFGRRLLAGRLDGPVRPRGRGGLVASRMVGRIGVSERAGRKGDSAVRPDRGDRRRVRLARHTPRVQAGVDA